MSLRQDRDRREAAREAAIERSKEVRRFDNRVAELCAEEFSIRAAARQLACSQAKVQASRVWLGLVGVIDAAAIEHSKTVRRFDAEVARLFAEGLSVHESARRLECGAEMVQASRVWMQLERVGAGHIRNSPVAVRILREAANG